MRTRALLVLCAVSAIATTGAQAVVETPVVSGVVRDAVTKRPIAGARVRIAAFNNEWCEPCLELIDSPSVQTDRAGRFAFASAPDTFILEADQVGYAVGGFGARRPAARPARIDLAAGQILADLEIPLFREAVVHGRVSDDRGKPVTDEEVWLSRVDARGNWQYYHGMDGDATPAFTDGRGDYTAYVAPGRYAVTVVHGDEPFFYPSAVSIHEASLVSLEPGEARDGVDVRLPARRIATVQARLDATADESIVGMHASARLYNARIEMAGSQKGSLISFTDVPYGDYMMEVRFWRSGVAADPDSVEWWVQTAVAVHAEIVGPIAVVPRRSIELSGTVTLSVSGGSVGVEIEGGDRAIPCGRWRSRDAVVKNGSFVLHTVPGEYRLCTWPESRFGWAASSAGGQDLGDLPFIARRDISDIHVVLTEPPTSLVGVVRDGGNHLIREGWVVVFPQDRRFWPAARKESPRFSAEQVTIAGTFQVEALIPGDYLIAAVDDRSMDGWPDPSWLERVAEGAHAIALGPGQERTTETLVLRSVPVATLAPPRVYRWTPSRLSWLPQSDPAQPLPPQFVIEGVVRDSNGHPAVRATVGWRESGSIFIGFQEVLTDREGHYRLSGLERGLYTLHAEGDAPFRSEPVLIGDGPMARELRIVELSEKQVSVSQNEVVDFRLAPARRPHFAGDWGLDDTRSWLPGIKPGTFDPGPVARSLHVYHREETINLGENAWSSGPIYRTDGSGETITFGAGPLAVKVNAVSHWHGEVLVTRWVLPATGANRAQSFTERRWTDKTGEMIVELRGSGGESVRRAVYRKIN